MQKGRSHIMASHIATMPKSTPNSGYPPPLVIPPLKHPHKQTFIILHGRGSWAEKFGPVLLGSEFTSTLSFVLDSESPSDNKPAESKEDPNSNEGIPTTTLRKTFPHARFVFPTAARRRATIYGRSHTHQWFDNWKLDPPATEREELQAPGLSETVVYLHGLLKQEIATVPGGASSVVLGGLSQGCAASLVSLLLLEGEGDENRLAGVFGMCGWLPYAFRLGEQLFNPALGGGEDGDDDDDPFERDGVADYEDPFDRGGSEEEVCDPPTRAVNWLREEIGVAARKQPCASAGALLCTKIPVFLGHGKEDDRVGVVLGRSAHSVLKEIGVEAEWREYEGLGHWYSPEMLRDLVVWIRERTGWEVEG